MLIISVAAVTIRLYLWPLGFVEEDASSSPYVIAQQSPKGREPFVVGLKAQSRTGAPQVVMLECECNDLMLAISWYKQLIWTLSFVYWILSLRNASLFPSSKLFWGSLRSNLRARVNCVSLRRLQELGPHRFNSEPMYLLSRILKIRWWLRAFIAYPHIDTKIAVSGL
jgi:hypothetical protein